MLPRSAGLGKGWPVASLFGGQTLPSQPVILAILAGQSNMEGRVTREAQDTDVAGVVQFVGDNNAPGYRTLSSDITPLYHQSTTADIGSVGSLGPGEAIGRKLLADNPTASIVLVPCARGSTTLVTQNHDWLSNATPGAGGYLFENMITQANLAYTATQSAYPGRPIAVKFFWVQGEFDGGDGVPRETYLAALSDLIARARARISGAANATFVIGSMVPEKWYPSSPTKDAGYIQINAAHVDASRTIAGVMYARGPDYVANSGDRDFLHYQPAQRNRDQGTAMAAALSDVTGPTMTSSATVGAQVGGKLSLGLSSNDLHSTFEIHGGADAAMFELSDPYLAPALRFLNDANAATAGNYAVNVRARDGSGNPGPDQAVTVTVSPQYGVGDQGPTTATYTGYAFHPAGEYYGVFVMTGVPLGVGMNCLTFETTGGSAQVTGVSGPGGLSSTAFLSRTDQYGEGGSVWGMYSAIAQTVDLTINFGHNDGTMTGITVNVVTLTGTKATPLSAALEAGTGSPTFSTTAVTCPAGGIVLCLGTSNGASRTFNSGVTDMAAQGNGGKSIALKRSTSGNFQLTANNVFNLLTTLVFEKSV